MVKRPTQLLQHHHCCKNQCIHTRVCMFLSVCLSFSFFIPLFHHIIPYICAPCAIANRCVVQLHFLVYVFFYSVYEEPVNLICRILLMNPTHQKKNQKCATLTESPNKLMLRTVHINWNWYWLPKCLPKPLTIVLQAYLQIPSLLRLLRHKLPSP